MAEDMPYAVSHQTAFSWLYDPRIRAVIDALEETSRGAVRFVGGCVRDSLLDMQTDQHDPSEKNSSEKANSERKNSERKNRGAIPPDIDLATSLTPDAVMKALDAHRIRYTATGIDHGTLTVHSGTLSLEITTLRADLETDGRHAVIRYSKNWKTDAQRRDFTINAFYLTPDGLLHDPLGGYHDLKRRAVRFIGSPAIRIAEDYLRILRFFRFSARFGPEPDSHGLEAVTAHISGLHQISRERIRDEFLKITDAPYAPDILGKMKNAGIFEVLALKEPHIDGFRFAHSFLVASEKPDLVASERAKDRPVCDDRPDDLRAILLLSILLPALPARALMDQFALSKKQFNHINLVRNLAGQFGYPENVSTLAHLHYKAGRNKAADALLVAAAARRIEGLIPIEHDRIHADLEKLTLLPARMFPVKAADIVEKAAQYGHMIHGAELGRALGIIENAWVFAGFPDDPKSIETLISGYFEQI